ncbi:hypothetical protein [Brevundimonas vesicularis]|nr:hypothetical protein [Brevundimonas vesicularis]MDX2334587.1 hypothetical protein [Brevundimonas vesicularis]
MPSFYPADVSPQVSNDQVVVKRLLHFAAGMEALAEHSLVDAQVSNLLTQMLGADPKPAIAMYETLNGARAEARALKAVGKETLSPGDNALLARIMTVCKTSSDHRDAIAHRLWMADDQYPDAVVLVDPKSLWRMSSKVGEIKAKGPVTDASARSVQDDIRAACQIWRMDDFDLAKRAASKAVISLIAFGEVLSLGDIPAASQKRSQLDAHLST